MAQLRSKKGNLIDCNILNESYDSYIVEINGKVGPVKKERIVSMNAIDEAILDRIKSGIKKGLDWIKNKIYKFFVKNGLIRVYDDEGRQIPASIPLNSAILAQDNDNMGYFPGEDDYVLAEELGLEIKFDPRVPSDKKGVDAGMTYDEYLKELGHPITEDAKSDADTSTFYRPIQRHATGSKTSADPNNSEKYIMDKDYDDVVKTIIRQYMDLRVGVRQQDVICLWGPPGIGKTAMIDEVLTRLRNRGYKNVRSTSLTGTGRPDNSMYLPGRETREYTGRNGKKYEKMVWSGNEMAGIPAYADNGLSPEDKLEADLFANGGRYSTNDAGEVVCTARPDGGILFIDEFSRANQDIMIEFMKIFSDAKFGTNIMLGSRWLVVLAANRKADMEGIDTAERFKLDSAQQCRIRSFNVIINPDTWLAWAKRTTRNLFKRDPDKDFYTDEDDERLPIISNVIPEVIEYIEGHRDALYDVAVYPDDEPEFTNQHAAKANPRAWHNVSKDLLSLMNAASIETGHEINTVMDLLGSGYDGINRVQDIVDEISPIVGTRPAEEFGIWLENKILSKDECIKIWKTGKTVLRQTPLFTAKDFIIPRFVEFNPNRKDAQSFMELLPPKALLNAIEFVNHLAVNGTGQGSAQAATENNYETLLHALERELMKDPRLNKHDLVTNISLLSPADKIAYDEAGVLDKLDELSTRNETNIQDE